MTAPDLRTGQVVTVFRNRLDPVGADAYSARIVEIRALAEAMAGFVDAKTFTADDGERVTVVTFADRASHDAWRRHDEHRVAQDEGRTTYYTTYSIQVADVVRAHSWTKEER